MMQMNAQTRCLWEHTTSSVAGVPAGTDTQAEFPLWTLVQVRLRADGPLFVAARFPHSGIRVWADLKLAASEQSTRVCEERGGRGEGWRRRTLKISAGCKGTSRLIIPPDKTCKI